MSEIVLKEYNFAKKPTALRGTFICPNCGAEIVRRLSKVKNKELVFCDNKCRAKYKQRLTLIQNGLELDNNVISKELNDMNKIIKYSVHQMAKVYPFLNDLDELEQIARITVWMQYKKAHDGKGKPENFYITCIKRAIKNSFNRTPVFERLDDFERDLQDFNSPENIVLQKEVVNKLYSKTTRSYQMLLASAFEGLSHKEIADKFKCTVRDVTANIYNAKRLIGAI